MDRIWADSHILPWILPLYLILTQRELLHLASGTLQAPARPPPYSPLPPALDEVDSSPPQPDSTAKSIHSANPSAAKRLIFIGLHPFPVPLHDKILVYSLKNIQYIVVNNYNPEL